MSHCLTALDVWGVTENDTYTSFSPYDSNGKPDSPGLWEHTPKETGQSLTDRLSLSGPRRAPYSRCSQEWSSLERFRDAGPNEHRMGQSSRYLPWLELKEPPEKNSYMIFNQKWEHKKSLLFMAKNVRLSQFAEEWMKGNNFTIMRQKKTPLVLCFTIRHSNVFIYTWAAHDPMFSAQFKQTPSLWGCITYNINLGKQHTTIFNLKWEMLTNQLLTKERKELL